MFLPGTLVLAGSCREWQMSLQATGWAWLQQHPQHSHCLASELASLMSCIRYNLWANSLAEIVLNLLFHLSNLSCFQLDCTACWRVKIIGNRMRYKLTQWDTDISVFVWYGQWWVKRVDTFLTSSVCAPDWTLNGFTTFLLQLWKTLLSQHVQGVGSSGARE